MNNQFLHDFSMGVIVGGSLILFSIAFLWYAEGNLLMGSGMLIMGLIALSNFYLHLVKMKNK